MKRFVLCALFCILAATAWTQERNFFKRFWNNFVEVLFTPQIHKPFSVAAGIEYAQNEREHFLPELVVIADYELSRYFGIGVRGSITFGSKQPEHALVSVMEGVGYGRFYPYDFGWIRPFIQVGIGISADSEQDYQYTDVLGETSAGVRAHWKGWFLEAVIRYGYPFRLAFGLGLGHSFLP